MGMITNQNEPTIFCKEDLQFYVPELCTYLVFHEQLKNMELQKLMVRACKVDIHFSLKYYFYMRSLQTLNHGDEQRTYPQVEKYNLQFRNMINNYYKVHRAERQFTSMINPNPFLPNLHPIRESSLILDVKAFSDGEDDK